MIKFKVTALDGLKRNEFILMRDLNTITSLNISNVFQARDAAIVTIDSYDELDKLLSPESCAKLNELKLKITPPPNYKPERSVFIPRVPEFISTANDDVIIQEINENNQNVKAIEVAIITPSNNNKDVRKTLKVVFQSKAQADLASNHGFHIGEMNIKPSFVHKEDYVNVPQCYRCFSYEHLVNECKAPLPTCSICSGSHNYKQCPDKTKILCCVCGAPHTAISPKCPSRKVAIQKLKDSNKKPKQNVNPSGNNPPNNSNPPGHSSNPSEFPSLPNSKPNAWTSSVLNNDAQVSQGFIPASIPDNQNNTQPPPSFTTPLYQPHSSQIHLNPQVSSHPQPPYINLNNQVPTNPVPSTSNNIKDHEWQIRLDIWKTLADKIAGDDHIKYTNIMNSFLIQYELEPITLPEYVITQTNNFQSQFPSPPSSPSQRSSTQISQNDSNNLTISHSPQSPVLPSLTPITSFNWSVSQETNASIPQESMAPQHHIIAPVPLLTPSESNPRLHLSPSSIPSKSLTNIAEEEEEVSDSNEGSVNVDDCSVVSEGEGDESFVSSGSSPTTSLNTTITGRDKDSSIQEQVTSLSQRALDCVLGEAQAKAAAGNSNYNFRNTGSRSSSCENLSTNKNITPKSKRSKKSKK